MADSNVGTSMFLNMKWILVKRMDLEEKETGGDEFLFWSEANAIESAQTINSLNPKVCEFYSEHGKFALECCVNKGLGGTDGGEESFLSAMGLFSGECGVLFDEYLKSAAECCIKKMRLRALLGISDKQRTLMIEIIKARMIQSKLWDIFTAFRNYLLATRKQKLQDDSHAHVVAAPEKSPPEIARGNLKARGFARETFRVLVEMMRGVIVGGQQPVSGLDDAMKLGKRWLDAVMGKCVMKIWVGTAVDRLSLFEVLKRECEENWKMEKELKDRILNFKRELAHLSPGFVTKLGPQSHVEGDDTIKGETSGAASVVEGNETIEVKKSGGGGVVEGDEAIKY